MELEGRDVKMNLVVLLLILMAVLAGLYIYNRRKVREAEALFPPVGQFVTVDGIRLHYICKGEGQPVVFLHGGILSASDYAQVIDLAATEYQAISFDRPGYGYSERPQKEMVTPIVQARLFRGALKKLGIEKPILVGHSWSGSLVLAYALEYPDELSGIVLLAPAAYGGKAYPAGKMDFLLYRIAAAPVLGNLLASTLLMSLGRILAKPAIHATFSPDPAPADFLNRGKALWPRPGQFIANREDVYTFSPTVDVLSKRYGEIRLPVVIVVGDSDPFHPELQSYSLHQAIPHSKLIVLPDTGHMIPTVRPEAVLEAVRIVRQQLSE
jgi:pimeloyl-ACP methyl ester carboxylesterase